MKRNFCGPCPGPFSVFHCIMFARPIQENPWEVRDSILGRVSEEYPIWNDFLTFSTGFSTDFVKKKRVFPQCFPLFPPSFPPFWKRSVIPVVFFRAAAGSFWGEMEGFFLFSKRKSRPKIYFLRRFALGAKAPLPSGIFDIRVFHKRCPAKTMCGKPWENPSFPQTLQGEKKSAPGAGRPAEALECWKIYTAP